MKTAERQFLLLILGRATLFQHYDKKITKNDYRIISLRNYLDKYRKF